MSERDKVMSKRDEIRRYLIAVFGQPMDSDHERQLEAHIECAELWGDYYHAKQNAEAEKKLAKLEAWTQKLNRVHWRDGAMMTGMTPKDIYQIGYAAALFGLGRELTALKAELDKEQR